MSNPLPEFYRRLRDAQQSIAKVDAYDLRSDDTKSKAVFQTLDDERKIAARRLVRHCLRHRKALEKVLA
jgi:hypothetical protein